MSLKKLFLERYLSDEKMKEGYYLRIRKKNYIEENIKVYYVGFKIFDLTIKKTKNGNKEKLIVNPQIFIPNSKNVYKNKEFISYYENIPNKVLKDFLVIEKYFNISIGSLKKGCKNPYYKLNFDLASKGKEIGMSKLRSLIAKYFDIEETRIVIGKDTLYFVLENRYINFYQLYDLRLKLLNGVLFELCSNNENNERYFKSVNLGLKFELNKEINEYDLELIENALVNRTKIYAGLDHKQIDNLNKLIDKTIENEIELSEAEKEEIDYINTKSPTNQEKQKQQDFMVELNKSNRDDINYITKDGDIKLLYSKDVKPFELEYVIYAGKKASKKTDQNEDNDFEDYELTEEKKTIGKENIKGRIDNTLVNGNEALFVEIKYGNGVIDDTNGIHKHLIDLYSCLKMNNEILDDYRDRVNKRKEIILGRDLNNEEKVKINKVRYDIICIYNNEDDKNKDKLSKDAVKSKIDSIYNENCYIAMNLNKNSNKIKICTAHNDQEICKDPNNYCQNLLYKTIPELISMINDLGCEVKIILVDNEFKKFEEYIR